MLTARGQILAETEVGLRDLTHLDPLNEESLLVNLQVRYKRDQIYTFLGSLLISINPFKRLAYYSPSLISEYQEAISLDDLPPHVYNLTHHVYQCMLQGDTDQTIVVTGEAASGKTENAKISLQYLVCSGTAASEYLREQLINANFVLEAFGNASTLHNDNSSRFGKFLEIEFDFKGDPVGGVISSYMLEKSRASPIKCPGERTFHIFYQILAGAPVSLLKSLKLQRSTDHYKMLKYSKCSLGECEVLPPAVGVEGKGVTGECDKSNFSITTRALEVVGFSSEQIDSVLAVLAAVLKLYNVNFLPRANIDGSEGVTLTNEQELYEVADLLGIEDSVLEAALTSRSFESNRNEIFISELSSIEASYTRDSTCRALYSRLFTWIVSQINECLKVRGRSGVRASKRNSIGILDVYGFDVLTDNSLEEFLINYCNEKLQQVYIDHEFKMTQEEYLKEALQWKKIDYFDNSIIIDLIETSILPLIDDESTNSHTLCHPHHLSHPHYTLSNSRQSKFQFSTLGATSVKSSSSVAINTSDECLLHKLNKLCGDNPYFECCSVTAMGTSCHSTSLPALLSSSMLDIHTPSTATPSAARSPTHHGHTMGCPSPHLMTTSCSSSNIPHHPQAGGGAHHPHAHSHRSHQSHFSPNLPLTHRPVERGDEYLSTPCFRVRHFAGTVTYCISGFTEKNADIQCPLVSCAMYCSSNPIVQRMFPEGNPRRAQVKRPTTLASQLRISLGALLGTLSSKKAHFIKCIKPNEERRAHTFHLPLVQHQVRYMLLLESAKLRRSGYAYSNDYESFLAKFKLISPHTWPTWRGLPIEGATQLLKELPHSLASSDFAFGRTKVFIKNFSTLSQLEELRLAALESLATMIQKTWRRWVARRKLLAMRAAQITISRNYRAWKKRRWLLWLSRHLPSPSPLARDWPSCPRSLRLANSLIKKLYHRNRCFLYRSRLDHAARARMREKLTASLLFRDRKMSYYATVAHPFLGEYVYIRRNEKFKRLAPEIHVVFADIVNKVSRTSGKSVQKLLVVSTTGILVLDHRTLDIKYRIAVEEIQRISLSPFADDLAIIHVSSFEPGTTRRRGVLMFQSLHVIEIVSKLFLVIQNATQQTPVVEIASEIQANFGREDVTVSFRCTECVSSAAVVKITRRTGRMDVVLTS